VKLALHQKAVAGLVSVVVLYGALLRLEAFERTYGPLSTGHRGLQLQERVATPASHLRPETVTWKCGRYPYRFDAKSYLSSAREMRYFYEARARTGLRCSPSSGWLAACLKVLCIPGLLMWLWSRRGCLVLTALVGSLAPFAVTWEVYPE
jgi:hypothetical protein